MAGRPRLGGWLHVSEILRGARPQTSSILGSTNGSSFATVVSSRVVSFNPASGNVATLTFAATSQRYVRVSFMGNTGWPAGQASALEVSARRLGGARMSGGCATLEQPGPAVSNWLLAKAKK